MFLTQLFASSKLSLSRSFKSSSYEEEKLPHDRDRRSSYLQLDYECYRELSSLHYTKVVTLHDYLIKLIKDFITRFRLRCWEDRYSVREDTTFVRLFVCSCQKERALEVVAEKTQQVMENLEKQYESYMEKSITMELISTFIPLLSREIQIVINESQDEMFALKCGVDCAKPFRSAGFAWRAGQWLALAA